MRAGFDASILGKGGGIEVYVKCLLAELLRLPGGHSWVLWCGSSAALATARLVAPQGARVVEAGIVGRLLAQWGSLGLGSPVNIESLAGALDVFHGPNYLLPTLRGRAALVVTVHDLSTLRYPEWHPAQRALRHRIALGRTARKADHVITDSMAVRAEVIEDLGVPADRVTAVHPAVAPGFRRRRNSELKLTLDRWDLHHGEYFLFAGAMEPRKNLARLLDAVAILQQRRPGCPPLILVGPSGWRNQELHERIGRAGSRVRHLGYLSDADLSALTAGCTAFVMPSLYEGFGLPVLEAMACGVPVLTSRCGALEEVAGGAAFLVEPRNTAEIAEGIERLLDDTALREDLGRRGSARAAQFSWGRAARETMSVYERAIAAKN